MKNNIYDDIRQITTLRREALQDLTYAVQGVLDYMNTYQKADGTEQEFNVLRVMYQRAKDCK